MSVREQEGVCCNDSIKDIFMTKHRLRVLSNESVLKTFLQNIVIVIKVLQNKCKRTV